MGTSSLNSARYRALREQLRQWRTDAGLTQRDLGKRLRKPHTYVHKTEAGNRRIDPIEFIDWCKACGISSADAIRRFAS
jgi:transcriptional regulator with XRE-family HTH domain